MLENNYQDVLEKAKHEFYNNKIKKLRKRNPKQWYSMLKKITRYDQHSEEKVIVEDIKDYSDAEQAEMIADNFSAVSQEYDKLGKDDIKVPEKTTQLLLKKILKRPLMQWTVTNLMSMEISQSNF